MRLKHLMIPLLCLLMFVGFGSTSAKGADHGDVPTLNSMNRHDANITDLHVWTESGGASNAAEADDGTQLLISLCTNDAIPKTAQTYQFPSDVQWQIFIDRHSAVDFSNAANDSTYGGTITNPSGIAADVTFTITFDTNGVPTMAESGIQDDDHALNDVEAFVGLRDDPFIRGPRIGRNVACMVLQMPLHALVHGAFPHECDLTGHHPTLLVWAGATFPLQTGPSADRAARALRSMFKENHALNGSLNPAGDVALGFANPDVVIFDTSKPAAYPNGRALTDDVVNLVGDPRVLSNDAPYPSANDVPFLTTFPYVAPPQGVANPTWYTINIPNGNTDSAAGNLSNSDPDMDQDDYSSANQ